MKRLWPILCRLADNTSSIWEGLLIFCIYGGGGLLLGVVIGIGWAIEEIADSWSVPLTHKYRDELK